MPWPSLYCQLGGVQEGIWSTKAGSRSWETGVFPRSLGKTLVWIFRLKVGKNEALKGLGRLRRAPNTKIFGF